MIIIDKESIISVLLPYVGESNSFIELMHALKVSASDHWLAAESFYCVQKYIINVNTHNSPNGWWYEWNIPNMPLTLQTHPLHLIDWRDSWMASVRLWQKQSGNLSKVQLLLNKALVLHKKKYSSNLVFRILFPSLQNKKSEERVLLPREEILSQVTRFSLGEQHLKMNNPQ